jgi:hypothetical protein
MFKIALAMVTPGFLFSAMRRLAISGVMLAGSTNSVQRRLAAKARELHSSEDADLKEVHSLLHPSASSPDGPAAPLVFKAADLIVAASRDSNRTG